MKDEVSDVKAGEEVPEARVPDRSWIKFELVAVALDCHAF
jgi:hypothetical protein